MPAAQVKLDYGDESLDRIVYLGDREKHFGVAHEAVNRFVNFSMRHYQCKGLLSRIPSSYLVIRSSILRGSRINVGRTTLLKSAPGRN